MLKFSTLLASAALLSAEGVKAVNTHYMYDPLSLSQSASTLQSRSHTMIRESESTQPAKQTIITEPVHAVKPAETQKKAEEKVIVKNDSGRLTAKQEWCVEQVTPNFFVQKDQNGAAISPLDQFNNFVNTICPALNLKVPNGVVVSSCFHTGYFLLRTLRPIADAAHKDTPEAEDFKKDFENYVDDFCVDYDDVLPIRTKFVKELNGIEDAETFQDACFAQLASEPKLNTWFDPIDPLSSITQKEICDLHFKVFKSLRSKQRTSLAEYVSFSYLASLDLFINAHAQEDFENCVNQEVVTHTSEWVTDYATNHPVFKNWASRDKMEFAANTALAIQSECKDRATCEATGACAACDGCVIAISRIYKEYEAYLNTLFASTFKKHSEAMFDKLHRANLELETA